jgi:outer membrane immunogenic protein
MIMKRAISGLGGLAVSALFIAAPLSIAGAADMAVKAPPVVVPAPTYSWTGCYVGVEGGGAWGRTRQINNDAFDIGTIFEGVTFLDTHVDGYLVGGTAGCNYQTANVVWGVEGDLSWANLKGQANSIPPFGAGSLFGAKVSWFDTFRGRVGYATDRILWYLTGGVAYADVKGTEPFDNGPGAPLPDVNMDRTGWTVGAGVEWRLPDPHWSIKAEYLYVDFGTKFYVFEPIDNNRNINLYENIVRVGLNYKFDWSMAPVATKY